MTPLTPYPKIPKHLHNNRKLTDKDIEKIKELYNQGMLINHIAKIYNVSWATIKSHCDEEYRLHRLELAKGRSKKRWQSDDKFRGKKYQNEKVFVKRHKELMGNKLYEYKKQFAPNPKEYYHINKPTLLQRMKNFYLKNRDRIIQKRKEKYANKNKSL